MKLDTTKPIAGVSYNGVDIPIIGSVDLLWTNASPTSYFYKDTKVSLPSDSYDGYLIEAKQSTNNNMFSIAYFNANATFGICVATPGASYQPAYRNFSISNKTLTFGYGFLGTTNNDGNAIPTRIWGVKFTL